ncbi:MAG: cytochrome-c oxidase, cbb3-type subunit III [Gammaproteobacteria bacterium]|jgi:cytochrome c oxidase cbb3-type subunit 3
MSDNENPTTSSDTGHVWDNNLRELTNQPPRWWMITLYLSGVFLVVYFILYPSIPTFSGYTRGVLGWTQMERYKENLAEIQEIRAPYENKIQNMNVAAINDDQNLVNYITHSAKVLFGDRCAPCHGGGGSGNPGYPVLADDNWLYGGDINTIQQSIANGRQGMMPGFESLLSDQELNTLAEYVIGLSKGQSDPAGKELFANKGCNGCHGADGSGMQMLGAANLTDAIWRFRPANIESVKYTIAYGVNAPGVAKTRKAAMPAFNNQLADSDIKKLAVYVHRLGGGQ